MLPPRYWSGFQHFNSVGHPNTQLEIGAGVARDSTGTADIAVSAGTLDLATVGENGLDANSLVADTKYYDFAIAKDNGDSAFLASLSPTAPLLPAGYTKFRRIGFFKTNGSAHVRPFRHVNNTWFFATKIRDRDKDIHGLIGPAMTPWELSVPSVEGVEALISVTGWASAAFAFFVMPGFVPNTAVEGFTYNFSTPNGGSLPARVMVDSAGQVKFKSTEPNTNFNLDTVGWVDPL